MSAVSALFVLASGGTGEKNLWDPTLLGILVVICAVGLFCGSVYLLLATNLGARLGFLVAAACLSGFMVLLTILWMTTQTPLNSPRGRLAEWEVREVVIDTSDSSIGAVRSIAKDGHPVPAEELANLRPAVEAALVTATESGHEESAEASPFAEFTDGGEFLTDYSYDLQSYEVGGETKRIFGHVPQYAAVQICRTLEQETPVGGAPPDPRCDPLVDTEFVIMQRDLGSLRQPPVFAFLASIILFGLSLLGLHWYEKDAQRRRDEGAEPVPATT